MYEQRAPEQKSDAHDLQPWRPPDTPIAEGGEAIRDGDRYVAVDEVERTVVTLAIAPWPTVDPETGRLDFGPKKARETRTVALVRFQDRVDRERGDLQDPGQLVRPIRVGDVFLVRGLAGPPSRWARVIDVTRAGRLAAKAALFATAAPAPGRDALSDFGIEDRVDEDAPAPPGQDEPPPSGQVAYPAV